VPELLAAGPARGGVAHVFGHVVAELEGRGVALEAIRLGDGPVPALEAARAAWAHRRALRGADRVYVELGSNDLAVFWFLVLACLVRRDVVAVGHDVSLKLVKAPGSGLAGGGSRWGLRIGHRLLSPLLDRPLVALAARRVARWGVLGEQAAERWAPRVRGPVTVLPHGADPPTAGAPAPSAGHHVLYAGYMSPDKGIDVLVEAWAAAGDTTELPLILAGSAAGPVHEAFVDDVRERSAALANTPRWVAHPPEDAFARLFAEAAIVVLPYRASSAASGILIRALAEGRCVLATDVPAARTALRAEVSGVVVAPGDAAALAAALRALLGDPARRDALGAGAGAYAAEHLSWARQVDEVQRLIGGEG
jgi:glycosyltransferase involved in cell wall biosynthesis